MIEKRCWALKNSLAMAFGLVGISELPELAVSSIESAAFQLVQ
jgi:hypothetical protein